MCKEVVRSEGFSIGEDQKIYHDVDFSCVVDSSASTYHADESVIKSGTWLVLSNIDKNEFEQEWKIYKQGKTQMLVKGGTIEGSNLFVVQGQGGNMKKQDEGEGNRRSLLFENDGFFTLHSFTNAGDTLHDVEYEMVSHFKSFWEWKEASPSEHLGHPSKEQGRNLAVNQFGEKTAVVFRISTPTHGYPSKSANEVSDGVFGTTSDTVTLTSMTSACSYNKSNIVPTSIAGLTYAAVGVVDYVVQNAALTFTTEIENEIKTTYESVLENIDHVLFHMVCIIVYYFNVS